MKIFGGYIQARKNIDGGVCFTTSPLVVVATNKEKAIGLAITKAKSEYLDTEGYYEHTGDVVEFKIKETNP